MRAKEIIFSYFVLLILNFVFCSIYATTVPKTTPFVQNVQRAIQRSNIVDTIDRDIVEFWEFLRTRADKNTLKVLKDENRLLHSALLSKLNNILRLAEEIGPRLKVCNNITFESALTEDIGNSVDILRDKLYEMKYDTDKCHKLGGYEDNVLKRRLVSRCLRKNTSKHRWELVPAVNKVAQMYMELESLESAMEFCKTFLSEYTS